MIFIVLITKQIRILFAKCPFFAFARFFKRSGHSASLQMTTSNAFEAADLTKPTFSDSIFRRGFEQAYSLKILHNRYSK